MSTFECTLKSGKLMLRLLDSLQSMNPQLRLECDPDGWRCTAKNEGSTCLTVFHIGLGFFDYYHCPKKCALVLQTAKTYKHLKAGFIHDSLSTVKLHMRYVLESAKFAMRLDTGLPKCRATEMEIGLAEDEPRDVVLDRETLTGVNAENANMLAASEKLDNQATLYSFPRLQIPVATLKGVLLDTCIGQDTLSIVVDGIEKKITLKGLGDGTNASMTLPHDNSDSSVQNHLLLSHLPERIDRILASFSILQVIAKVGNILGSDLKGCNQQSFWEIILREDHPMVFRLPLYAHNNNTINNVLENSDLLGNSVGRNGSALKFFQNGFGAYCNSKFDHMTNLNEENLPEKSSEKSIKELKAVQKAMGRPVRQRDIALEIDPIGDIIDNNLPIENDDNLNIRDGIITFIIPQKQKITGGADGGHDQDDEGSDHDL